jgi:hypothetical protein
MNPKSNADANQRPASLVMRASRRASARSLASEVPLPSARKLTTIATMSPHDSLAVAEAIIYGGVALPISIFLWVREEWRRCDWMFVFLLASIRIIGSILQLVEDESGPRNKPITIVNGTGLSPLLGIMLMLVHRLYAYIPGPSNFRLTG